MLILLSALTLAAALTDPEVLPPPPSETEMLETLRSERDGARIVSTEAIRLPNGSTKVCGTAEIAGQIEPFALLAEEGPRSRPVITMAGETPPTAPPPILPRHWKVNVYGPGNWNAIQGTQSNPHVEEMNAFARGLVRRICPALRAPDGVVWAIPPEPPVIY
ncbi:hypothetical protein [Brevundimonas sp. M20]|uniref:hypothetical protein n=1 Tax=Brevundimonas sp. M20 TaxID=2591463 RepID=UPI001147482E|nr:hypothetical protein [Brevundimonas sp. M20]QDH73064.1 hypothetical protein FKQ52_06280 [Brevundimonas sp. M20]